MLHFEPKLCSLKGLRLCKCAQHEDKFCMALIYYSHYRGNLAYSERVMGDLCSDLADVTQIGLLMI